MNSRKIVVADAGPLIAFGRINFLSLLSDTLGKIIIPEAVANECLLDISRPGAIAIQKAIHEKTLKVLPSDIHDEHHELLEILGKGETAAIALASKLNIGILIDEKLGRNAARKLNLKVIGTAGVLLLAKQNKFIDKVSPLIHELKKVGYYLSAELVREILKQAREKA